jgi:hypothetical protein
VGARERPHGERSWSDPEGRRRGTPRRSKQLKSLWLRTVTPAEAADRLLSPLDSRRLGHPTRVAARIVGCCLDRRGRQGLRCIGKQLGRVVGHRLIRINRIRLREWRNHGMSKPARRVNCRSRTGTRSACGTLNALVGHDPVDGVSTACQCAKAVLGVSKAFSRRGGRWG